MKQQEWEEDNMEEKIMKKMILIISLGALWGMVLNAAPTYEYRRELREGARGKWINLRQHLNSGQRLEREITKVDKQIDRKVKEIHEIEDLLFRIEQYKVENNIR